MRRSRLTETSLVVTWMTEGNGKVKTVAKGALRPKSRFAGLLDLFYGAQISFARSRRSDLHVLHEVSLEKPRDGLRQLYSRVRLASYFVELIDLTTEADHPTPELYDLLRRGMDWVSENMPDQRAMLHYESELARLLGIGRHPSPAVAIGRACGRLPKARAELLRSLVDQ